MGSDRGSGTDAAGGEHGDDRTDVHGFRHGCCLYVDQCETTQWQSSRGERPKVVRSHIVPYSPFLTLSSAVLWASGLQVRSKSDSRFEDDPEAGVRGGQLPQ